MIHAREDYNGRIVDLAEGYGGIHEQEPVFLLRARDRSAPDLVRQWAERNRNEPGCDPAMSAMAWDHANEMAIFAGATGGFKTADLPDPDRPPLVTTLTLRQLRLANVRRLPEFKTRDGRPAHSEPDGSDWSVAEWGNALAGEVGELCNVLKKVRRGDVSLELARPEIAAELADVQTYLDLVAFRCGVDLGRATKVTFNSVSERVGSGVRL